jgi:hypothetical protein
MSYKAILAHCNDTRRVTRVANVAAELAERFRRATDRTFSRSAHPLDPCRHAGHARCRRR